MSMEYFFVNSSMVAKLGFDAETGEMEAHCHKGHRVSVYGDEANKVSEALFQAVLGAESVGKAINMYIKPQFAHRYKGL